MNEAKCAVAAIVYKVNRSFLMKLFWYKSFKLFKNFKGQ